MEERWNRRPSGLFVLRQWRRGRLVDESACENLVVDRAREVLARTLGGNPNAAVSEIGFGTNGVAAAPDDELLTDEYRRQLVAVDYPALGQVRFTWELDELEANGLAIQELGLWSGDGRLVARRVRGAPIVKDDGLRLEGTWTITF